MTLQTLSFIAIGCFAASFCIGLPLSIFVDGFGDWLPAKVMLGLLSGGWIGCGSAAVLGGSVGFVGQPGPSQDSIVSNWILGPCAVWGVLAGVVIARSAND